MLSFDLRHEDAVLDWHPTTTGVARGTSRIDPFRHSAIEEVIAAHDSRLLVGVRERCAGLSAGPEAERTAQVGAHDFDRLVEQMRTWPLQWHMLVVNGHDASLEAGSWGTAPVFLAAEADHLRGDWDADRLLPHLHQRSLDPVRAVRWLSDYATPYARHTLFRDLLLLTERARASWRRGPDGVHALTIDYPLPWPRPVVGTLREGADPVGTFDAILTASMHRWTAASAGAFSCELSGGLDSGIVTATAAIMCGSAAAPRRSYGLSLAGPADAVADQRARRAELVTIFGLHDTDIPMAKHLPLAPGSCRLDGRAPVLPWEEGYYEAMNALLERARVDGAKVMLTGFGGDELCGLRPSELLAMGRAPRASAAACHAAPRGTDFLTPFARATLDEELERPPRAASCDSSVEVAALSAARYLRHGLWPVHPLCTPELVRFCARLPVPWRAGRTVERQLLARHGVSPQVTHPRFRDDFSPALALGMRTQARPLLTRLFANSALADQGLVDGDRLRRGYAEWCDTDQRAGAERFYAAASLELCLHRMG